MNLAWAAPQAGAVSDFLSEPSWLPAPAVAKGRYLANFMGHARLDDSPTMPLGSWRRHQSPRRAYPCRTL
jgi:hypothetical protein